MPPGFLDLRSTRRKVGPRAVPGWQESDEYAPSAGEDAVEMRAIAEMDDCQLKAAARAWRREIAGQEQRERAAGAPQSGRKEGAEKLRSRTPELVAAFKPPPGFAREQQRARRAYQWRLEKLLASLEAPALLVVAAKPRAGRYTRAELEATRARLMDEAVARHEQHQAARLRWATADGIVRDKATTGGWRVLAQLAPPFAEVVSLTDEQLRALWPKPNETHITVPYDRMTIRARLLIGEGEIDRDFPADAANAASSAPECDATIASNGLSGATDAVTSAEAEPPAAPIKRRRLQYRGLLKRYLATPQFTDGHSDREIAVGFQSYCTEKHRAVPLPQKNSDITKHFAAIRAELQKEPARHLISTALKRP